VRAEPTKELDVKRPGVRARGNMIGNTVSLRSTGRGFPWLFLPMLDNFLDYRSMDRAQLQERLAQADRHMAELKARIARQRLILGRTLAECRRLLVAKSTLQAFEGSLHKFGEHCELILDQLKRRPSE
jgi:hypothetical protein